MAAKKSVSQRIGDWKNKHVTQTYYDMGPTGRRFAEGVRNIGAWTVAAVVAKGTEIANRDGGPMSDTLMEGLTSGTLGGLAGAAVVYSVAGPLERYIGKKPALAVSAVCMAAGEAALWSMTNGDNAHPVQDIAPAMAAAPVAGLIAGSRFNDKTYHHAPYKY